jgi:hypothetical protein
MPRTCSICSHPDRVTIDDALVSGTSYRDIAKRVGDVTIASLGRHASRHVSAALVSVQVERSLEGPRTAVARIEELIVRGERILDSAERGGAASLSLSAMRELRGLIELYAKLSGELDERPTMTINLQSSPEWVGLRTTILRCLEPFPEARLAVAQGVAAAESGRVLEIGAGG